jgi:hypothetical protein
MRHSAYYSLILLFPSLALAQTSPAEPPSTLTMISEIRQLRTDLQTTAATIQRVQIVMYRLQVQANLLDRAEQRLEGTRNSCEEAQQQRKMAAARTEQLETQKRTVQYSAEQVAALDQELSMLKSSDQASITQEQQCQVNRTEAEAQAKTEQARMSALEDQLDRLDRALATFAGGH